jgi:transposase
VDNLSVLIDYRLFLSKSWVRNDVKRIKTGVPFDRIEHKTKPELALEMLDSFISEGMPFTYVQADGLYGHDSKFISGLYNRGVQFICDIPSDTLARVPETIKEAQSIVSSDVTWSPCTDQWYSYVIFESSYGDVNQRGVLFNSSEQQKRSIQTQKRNITKYLDKDKTALRKLCVNGFACEADARKTVDKWMNKHPRYLISDITVSVKNQRQDGKRGRPKKDEVLEQVYFISCEIELNQEVITQEQERMGRFILTSNDTTIDPEVMLTYYKEQSTVERGFRFIKDKTFHASEVYLENENRIAALVMIMVLCLLVYSIVEWQFRNILKENKFTIRDQFGKPTEKPRSKWVFFLFRRVRQIDLRIKKRKVEKLLNITDEILDIAKLIGPGGEKYYS